MCITVLNFMQISQTIVAIWPFFDFLIKMPAVCRLGFVLLEFRPPTKSIWWSL